MSFPIGSHINLIPAPPYLSQREALLYEILQALGGNPQQLMGAPWSENNGNNSNPPYKSLTDALLYEIWQVIHAGNLGTGTGGADSVNIFYGLTRADGSIIATGGIPAKAIKSGASYYVVPPAVSNIAAAPSPDAEVIFWIAEPETEPAKTGTLWLRNQVSTFVNEEVQPGAMMEAQLSDGYRIYTSTPMAVSLFDGLHIGPVFMTQVFGAEINWGGGSIVPVYTYQIGLSANSGGNPPQQFAYSPSTDWAVGMRLYVDSGLTMPISAGYATPYDNNGIDGFGYVNPQYAGTEFTVGALGTITG